MVLHHRDYHADNPFGTEVTADALVEDFELLDDWESRYRFLIELGRRLPAMPDCAKHEPNRIHGCQSQAWIACDEVDGRLWFLIDSDAHIVRGLIAIVMSAVNGQTAAAILSRDIRRLFDELDLVRHLSPTRGNGLNALVARVRAIAAAHDSRGDTSESTAGGWG